MVEAFKLVLRAIIPILFLLLFLEIAYSFWFYKALKVVVLSNNAVTTEKFHERTISLAQEVLSKLLKGNIPLEKQCTHQGLSVQWLSKLEMPKMESGDVKFFRLIASAIGSTGFEWPEPLKSVGFVAKWVNPSPEVTVHGSTAQEAALALALSVLKLNSLEFHDLSIPELKGLIAFLDLASSQEEETVDRLNAFIPMQTLIHEGITKGVYSSNIHYIHLCSQELLRSKYTLGQLIEIRDLLRHNLQKHQIIFDHIYNKTLNKMNDRIDYYRAIVKGDVRFRRPLSIGDIVYQLNEPGSPTEHYIVSFCRKSGRRYIVLAARNGGQFHQPIPNGDEQKVVTQLLKNGGASMSIGSIMIAELEPLVVIRPQTLTNRSIGKIIDYHDIPIGTELIVVDGEREVRVRLDQTRHVKELLGFAFQRLYGYATALKQEDVASIKQGALVFTLKDECLGVVSQPNTRSGSMIEIMPIDMVRSLAGFEIMVPTADTTPK